MKTFTPLCLFLASATLALANTAPTVVIQSAQMRPGTTLMDVVFRVNDPDDATVKTRALAFVDGVRSFAKVLKPVTFVEGTAAKLGDAITANTDHTLTWDVGADWNVSLGQVKFEVLAMDGRGLLPLDWITIPAAGGNPALAVSKNSPTDPEVLDALFWQYADGDSGLSLAGGILTGNPSSGVFNQVMLANGSTIQPYSTAFIFKRMNLDPDDGILVAAARVELTNPQGWHATNRPYAGVTIVTGWGDNSVFAFRNLRIPPGMANVVAIEAEGRDSIALKSDGTVVAMGTNLSVTPPVGLSGVIAISASSHTLALKGDGTVVGWGGSNAYGQATIPVGLNNVTAIAAGGSHSLALKSDGTVIGWGSNQYGQSTVPVGLNNVTAIAAGVNHSLALKSDGTVIGWGYNIFGQTSIPQGLTGVTAISARNNSLALKSDGTVVSSGSTPVPAGLTGVTAISGDGLALKSDGTVVSWGSSFPVPTGLTGVTHISEGSFEHFVIKAKAP